MIYLWFSKDDFSDTLLHACYKKNSSQYQVIVFVVLSLNFYLNSTSSLTETWIIWFLALPPSFGFFAESAQIQCIMWGIFLSTNCITPASSHLQRMVTYCRQDGYPQSAERSTTIPWKVTTFSQDGQPPSLGWSPTIPMTVTHHPSECHPPFQRKITYRSKDGHSQSTGLTPGLGLSFNTFWTASIGFGLNISFKKLACVFPIDQLVLFFGAER